MRVLVISDVHGNREALEAVAAEPHDSVICLGDLVGYGPEPAACVQWARAHAQLVLQGNHDRALAEGVAPGCRAQFLWLAEALAPLGRAQLAEEDITYLRQLPRSAALEIDGGRFLFVHATPRDPLYRYVGPEPDAWSSELAGIDADVVAVGHTHLQFDLSVGAARVVNPGSVGQPKDGDPRAAYAVIEDRTITLKRTAYPVEQTVTALEHSGVDPAAVRALSALLRTGRVPPAESMPSGRAPAAT
jgi:putative phosphoesterase